MSDFEYASVVVSIVLALGIADVLRYLADTFRESGSRNLYWVHLLWIVILFQLHVEFWWRMWSFRDLVTVGPSLGLVLLGPAMLFVTTRTMLPADARDNDLQALFFSTKKTVLCNVSVAQYLGTDVQSMARRDGPKREYWIPSQNFDWPLVAGNRPL